jgi:hypothetical protein
VLVVDCLGIGGLGQFHDLFDDVVFRRVDHHVGAEVFANLKFVGHDVDGDDVGVGPFAHHDLMNAEAAAGAEHGDRVGRRDAGAPENFIGRCDGVADNADIGRLVLVIEPFGKLDEITDRQLDIFGVAAVDLAADIAAVDGRNRFAARPRPLVLAVDKVEIGGHRITDGQTAGSGLGGADLDDFTGNFMADDDREVRLAAPRLDVVDGQPRPASEHFRHRLTRARRRVGHLFQRKRLAGLMQYLRFHELPPWLNAAPHRRARELL